MKFAQWGWLVVAALIPFLHFFWRRQALSPRLVFSFGRKALLKAKRFDSVNRFLSLRYVALALLLVALARPQTSFTVTERKVSGVDIIMVMDVSASMKVEDLGDRSRLEIAKETMQSFIKGRQNDRIGFVVFSGEPLTLAPPTLDYGLVISAVRGAETGVLKDGTGIGDGLALAINRLKDSQAKSRIVILLTDGDNNVGQIDPSTAGELAAGYGIKVYTIAIGKEGRVRIPVDRPGFFGKTIRTYQWLDNALNPELLQKIAQLTDGKFYRVADEDTLNQVFREIDSLERSEIQMNEKVNFEDQFPLPLKLGLVLLLIEFFLFNYVRRAIP